MREKLEALVGAKISEFRRKMAEVKKTVRSIPNEVWINVRVNYKKAQQRLDNIADTIRTLQTVGGNMVLGSMLDESSHSSYPCSNCSRNSYARSYDGKLIISKQQ
nr:hypothetical protein [Fredinandcohnia onubensis]